VGRAAVCRAELTREVKLRHVKVKGDLVHADADAVFGRLPKPLTRGGKATCEALRDGLGLGEAIRGRDDLHLALESSRNGGLVSNGVVHGILHHGGGKAFPVRANFG